MTISVLKTLFRKLLPKIINYKGFKKNENERFINSLQYSLSEEDVDYRKNPDKLYEICYSVPNNHAPRRKIFVEIRTLS